MDKYMYDGICDAINQLTEQVKCLADMQKQTKEDAGAINTAAMQALASQQAFFDAAAAEIAE